jgi:uncharacterized protein
VSASIASVYYVTFYHQDPAGDPTIGDRLMEAYPRHRAYLDEFAKGGQISMIGTFDDPFVNGSMGVFRSREAAEEFLANDPFVTEGLVFRHELREWSPLEYPAGPVE